MASVHKYKADLSYSEPITAEKIIVKYDGTLYDVARDSTGGYGNGSLPNPSVGNLAGDPFYITAENGRNVVYTSSRGQHTIEISEDTSKIETTECFKKAVKSVGVGGGVMMLTLNDNFIEGATWQEALAKLNNGTMLFLNARDTLTPCHYFNNEAIAFSSTIVDTDANQVYTWKYEWTPDGAVQYTESIYSPQS